MSGVWYLGSLSIDPREQNRGLGRRFLTAAEDWIREAGGREIKMTVINVRDTLLAWYARRGYMPTNEIKPFPYDDNRFGLPKRDDLYLGVLHKCVGPWPCHRRSSEIGSLPTNPHAPPRADPPGLLN